jgi:hypothetical protein
VNDAPALGAADVGIAMGVAGSAAAMETADVALLTNDLTKIAETIAIGRLCLKKIRENIAFSLIAKGAVLALSLAGITGLWEAVAADVGMAMVVILNGMTVLVGTEDEKQTKEKNRGEILLAMTPKQRESAPLTVEMAERGEATAAGGVETGGNIELPGSDASERLGANAARVRIADAGAATRALDAGKTKGDVLIEVLRRRADGRLSGAPNTASAIVTARTDSVRRRQQHVRDGAKRAIPRPEGESPRLR